MNAWSSMVARFRDHVTPSGRRSSKPERQARKRHAQQVNDQVARTRYRQTG